MSLLKRGSTTLGSRESRLELASGCCSSSRGAIQRPQKASKGLKRPFGDCFRLLATLLGAPRASAIEKVGADLGINFVAMVFLGFLTYQELLRSHLDVSLCRTYAFLAALLLLGLGSYRGAFGEDVSHIEIILIYI